MTLPKYISKATQEEKKQTLVLMEEQIKLIVLQEQDEIPSKFTKIRCPCNKLVCWKDMYKCLYCGCWFCKECAEEHFGYLT